MGLKRYCQSSSRASAFFIIALVAKKFRPLQKLTDSLNRVTIYMQDGGIKKTGTHEELLARHGAYAELYNSQFAGA